MVSGWFAGWGAALAPRFGGGSVLLGGDSVSLGRVLRRWRAGVAYDALVFGCPLPIRQAQAMRASPYLKPLEEQAVEWEKLLLRTQVDGRFWREQLVRCTGFGSLYGPKPRRGARRGSAGL